MNAVAKKISYLLLAISLSSCVSFTSTPIITHLPKDIADRNNYLNTADWKYELAELAGSILILYKTPVDGKMYDLGKRIINKNLEPKVEIITGGEIAKYLIDNHVEEKLKVIGLGDVQLSNKDKVEFTYTDTTRVFIKQIDWDYQALKEEANKNFGANIEARYFIQGALLSSIQRKKYSEVNSGLTTIIEGTGLKAGGKIYSSNSAIEKDFTIHLTLRNLDDFKGELFRSYTPNNVKGLWITDILDRKEY